MVFGVSNTTCTEIFINLIIEFFQYIFLRKVSIGLAVFCIPWLRWKQPDWERPIRVNLIFPIVYILCTIFITVVPMIITPKETGEH